MSELGPEPGFLTFSLAQVPVIKQVFEKSQVSNGILITPDVDMKNCSSLSVRAITFDLAGALGQKHTAHDGVKELNNQLPLSLGTK